MDASCCLLIFCILLSFSVLLLLLMMKTIEPLEYGITYNSITKDIGTHVYEGGRYFLIPWKSFIVYPAYLVTVEFSDSRRASVRKHNLKISDILNNFFYLTIIFSPTLCKLELLKVYPWDYMYHSNIK